MKDKIVVSLLSQKGGIAKSTLARLLGVGLVRTNEKAHVHLLDVDVNQQTCVAWYQNRLKLREELSKENAKNIPPGLHVVGCGSAKDVKDFVTDNSGIFIVDTPGQASKLTFDLAKYSDYSIFPFTGSLDSFKPQVDLVQLLTEAGLDRGKFRFIMSMADNSVSDNIAKKELRRLGIKIYDGSIPIRASFKSLMNRGYALNEGTHPALQAKIVALVEEVLLDLLN